MQLLNCGLLKDIFFATNLDGQIRGIFFLVDDRQDSIHSEVTKVFEKPILASKSSIELKPTNSKLMWAKDDTVLFVTKPSGSKTAEITIIYSPLGIIVERTPDISLECIYQH